MIEQPRPWLPGVHWEFRPTNFWWWLNPDADSGLVAEQPQHSLFHYLTRAGATWHQHGVFWPPDGAAVLYIDRVSTDGTLGVSSLDPMAHVGSYLMAAPERLLDGYLLWAAEELL